MKKILFLIIIIFTLGFGIQSALAVYGLEQTAESAGLSQTGSVQDIAGDVIGAGLTMVGVLFLMLMIYGGIMWMLARGNEETSRRALNTITAAVIGLIIVTASYAITNFVFSSVSGGQGTSSSGAILCCVYPDNNSGTEMMEIVTDQEACTALCESVQTTVGICDTQATIVEVNSASECAP